MEKFNLLGFPGVRTFQNKAEALQYAINFTAINADGGRKADYEAAQEMFDFICKNVKLPETKDESLDGFMSKTSNFIDSLCERIGSIDKKEYPVTPEECCENRDECGPSEAPPARPEIELSQDRFKFDPRVTPDRV